MELETAARKHLLNQVKITNQTGKGATGRIWKFHLEEGLEGTGQAAIVLNSSKQWAKPGMNSQEYPILVVECYADHSRDDDADQTKDDAMDRAKQLYREVDRVLHQTDRLTRHWPENDDDGLLILGCFRGTEPDEPVQKHGVQMVRGTYDVQIIHEG